MLAHQSQLLMSDVASDERLMNVLMEVEQLMSCLEEERQRHASEIQQLQDKLEMLDSNERLEILEERLKLTESELFCAVQRADRAELKASQLNEKSEYKIYKFIKIMGILLYIIFYVCQSPLFEYEIPPVTYP